MTESRAFTRFQLCNILNAVAPAIKIFLIFFSATIYLDLIFTNDKFIKAFLFLLIGW